MAEFTNISYHTVDRVAHVRLNRPDKLNALSVPLMRELGAVFDIVEEEDAIRAVVLSGSGRSFCAGYDLEQAPPATSEAWRERAADDGHDVVMKLWNSRVPVVAAVHGYALGGGCDLVLASDLAVMADDALIGLPEIRYGSSPPTVLLPWVAGAKHAKELMLTGEPIGAAEAHRLGLVNRVVPAASLADEAEGLARNLAEHPPLAVARTKRAINEVYAAMGLSKALAHGLDAFIELMQTPESEAFNEAVAKKGLKAALADFDDDPGRSSSAT